MALSLTLLLFAFSFITGCGPKPPATAPTETTAPAASPAAAPSVAATEAAPSPSPTEKKPRPVVTLTDAQKKQVKALVDGAFKLEMKGKIPESIIEYVKALQIDPNNISAYDGKGRLQMRQMQYPDALDAFKNIVDLDPKNTFAYMGIGRCQMEMKDFDASVAAYEEALKLQPNLEPALSGLASTYFFKGHSLNEKDKRVEAYKKSVEFFKKAIAADSKRDGNYKKLLDAAKTWHELDTTSDEPVKEAVETANAFYKKFPHDKRLTPAIQTMIQEMQIKPEQKPQ
jgi:tetratricopeptide (TPR) repeat protein